MNKKHILLLAPLIIAYSLQSMEIDPPAPTLYLIHPEKYEIFRLTRPYGTVRSNFDCLSQDLFKTHIRQPLAKIISGKFKHAILNNNWQEKTRHIPYNPDVLKPIFLGLQKDTVFQHHDGNYTLAPNIGCNYVMWDETPRNRKVITATSIMPNFAGKYAQLLCNAKQEKPEIAVYFPWEQYVNDNKAQFSVVIADKPVSSYSLKSRITHQVMSNDGEWLALGCQRESYSNVTLFNLTSFTSSSTSPRERITALSAAHKSPLFVACLEDNTIQLITPIHSTYIRDAKSGSTNNNTVIDAQFSQDDQRLITYGENILELLYLPEKGSTSYINFTITVGDDHIRKALFTPDGKRIIIAMANGDLFFYDGFTGQPVTHYEASWRYHATIGIDNQPPLILCSSKNRLLFSLDPAQHIMANNVDTFVVRKSSGKFNFLMPIHFYPYNPRAMGLTEDERSVVFIHNDDKVSILHLYTDRDMKDIDFIEQEAHIYQLCELFQICKQCKIYQPYRTRNYNAHTLVNTIRTYIKNHQSSTENIIG
jgi:WD40 repeat protein